MIIIPGIIARHHYWHIAHCNTSQWTHQPGARRQARPLPLVWATFWWCQYQYHDSWLMILAPCLLRITLSTPITTWHSDGQTDWLTLTRTFIYKLCSYLSGVFKLSLTPQLLIPSPSQNVECFTLCFSLNSTSKFKHSFWKLKKQSIKIFIQMPVRINYIKK